MSDSAWRVLAEFVEGDDGGGGDAAQGIAAAVRGLDLPPVHLELLTRAAASAVLWARQGHSPNSPVAVRVLARGGERSGRRPYAGWGFFLIERAAEGVAPPRIDVHLYPGEGDRPAP